MSILDVLKGFIGVHPVRIGDINQQVTRQGSYLNNRTERNAVQPALDPLANVEITPEYKKVIALINSGYPLIFVTGKAGTGKSTLIHYIRSVSTKNIVVVAPTGVAALNVKGSTIHSFFQFPPRIVSENDVKRIKDRRLYNKLDILIIDEISMVRADLMDAIDRFLRMNGRDNSLPFGGVVVLMVGNLFQLSPVVQSQEWDILSEMGYGSPFFFSARCLQDNHMAPIELNKIFRQTDVAFTNILNQIRIGENLTETVEKVNNVCFANESRFNPLITLTCTNAKADAINAGRLQALAGSSHTYIGETSGRFSIDEGKNPDKLPSPYKLTLKVGSQVMFTKNDELKRWVNGTIGIVKDLDANRIQVELMTGHSGVVHDVQRVMWESFRYRYDQLADKIVTEKMGQYRQFPLMLAWAITIHKSQGKTLEKVEINLGKGAFAPGQVYVALSRCPSLSDISLSRPIMSEEVRCDERIKCFYSLIDASLKNSVECENDAI